jgi:hypothetical protein
MSSHSLTTKDDMVGGGGFYRGVVMRQGWVGVLFVLRERYWTRRRGISIGLDRGDVATLSGM